MEKELRIQGNNTSPVADLRAAIAAHRLLPVVDLTFTMTDAAETYARLAAGGHHFGKIAMVVD